jgi:hypothetical protein
MWKNCIPNISAIRVIRGHLNRQIPKKAEPLITRITRIGKNCIPNISAIRVIRGHWQVSIGKFQKAAEPRI